MRVKCLFCDNEVTQPYNADIPIKSVALRSWVKYCLNGSDLCPTCEKMFIDSVQDMCFKIQETLSDAESMFKQYTNGVSMKDVIYKHPDGDFEKLFDKLLKDGLYIRDDFGLLIIKVGWRFTYSKLNVVSISSITGLTIRDVVEKLLREVPKYEWRWDLECCNKVGLDNCETRIALGPIDKYTYFSNTTESKTDGYEQLTLKFY